MQYNCLLSLYFICDSAMETFRKVHHVSANDPQHRRVGSSKPTRLKWGSFSSVERTPIRTGQHGGKRLSVGKYEMDMYARYNELCNHFLLASNDVVLVT